MKNEEKLIDFVCRTRFEDIPEAVLRTVRNQFLTIVGTTVAGAAEDGCEEAVQFYRELGGKEEATILIYGGKIPAHDAAFVNAAYGPIAKPFVWRKREVKGSQLRNTIVNLCN
jgi:2-methylcitrate dehydratase PrpD